MQELIARLEQTTKPSRAVDGDIALACGWDASDRPGLTWAGTYPANRERWFHERGVFDNWHVPRYTASIDAAWTLVDESHYIEQICQVPAGWNAKVSDKIDDTASWDATEAPSPALALCIAALKARAP